MSDLRYCICADPENCTETIPGYVCRKVGSPMTPDTPDLRLEEIQQQFGNLGYYRREDFGDESIASTTGAIGFLLQRVREAQLTIAQLREQLNHEVYRGDKAREERDKAEAAFQTELDDNRQLQKELAEARAVHQGSDRVRFVVDELRFVACHNDGDVAVQASILRRWLQNLEAALASRPQEQGK